MTVLKSVAIAGLAAASLTLIPVKPAVALDYYTTYGMYKDSRGLYHSSNGYVEYIIQHESSGRPWATNYLGCIGLMQSCPYKGSPAGLAVACPNWSRDIECQLNFFTSYMQRRYGSWPAAYQFSDSRGRW